MRALLCILLLIITSHGLSARPTYTGYSGSPGRGSCAATCHGSGGGTVQVTGFPTSYTPNETYLITIQRQSGSTIKNFNASCRIGTGNQNAGVIGAGQGTATYSVNGESNGVHLSQIDQASATFSWTAPGTGTGTVRLYVAAHQGVRTGPNTTIVAVASEAVSVPGMAGNPLPLDLSDSVLLSTSLSWTAGTGAISHDLYFGTDNNPPLIQNLVATSYDPPGDLEPNTTYFWHVDARNDAGVAPGPLWQFTTLSLPEAASNPFPANLSADIPLALTASWTAAPGADSYDVSIGTTPEVATISGGQTGTNFDFTGNLTYNTTYYWRVDAINSAGVTQGELWQFHTVQQNAADGRDDEFLPSELTLEAAYPNPFNAAVTLPFALPKPTNLKIDLFDISGRLSATLAEGHYAEGRHQISFTSDKLSSGVYLAKLTAGHEQRLQKLVVLK